MDLSLHLRVVGAPLMEADAPPPAQDAPQQPPAQSSDAREERSDRGSTTAVVDRPPPRHLPAFKVLLHNDDVNTLDHVVQSLVELTPLEPQRAVLVTKEANDNGLALVLVTHRERAELYQEQLVSKSLTVTIEPA